MTNSNFLKSKMVANGYTQEKLAKKLNISKPTMSYKINGKRTFNASEMAAIYYALKLTPQEAIDIFFG